MSLFNKDGMVQMVELFGIGTGNIKQRRGTQVPTRPSVGLDKYKA